MESDVHNVRIFAAAKATSGCSYYVLLMKAVRGCVCIRQEAHKSSAAKGLQVHLTKERRSGRKVNLFNSVPYSTSK